MIKYNRDMTTIQNTNMRGGVGTYDSQLLFGADECAKTKLFAINTMPPHTSIGVHPHNEEGEAYIILQGTATVYEDDVRYTLKPGDAEYCTGGHTHGIGNDTDDETLVYLAIIIK